LLALPNIFSRTKFKQFNLLRFSLSFVLFFSFFNFLFGQEPDVQAGKKLFNANCAACHKLNKKAVGPALKGVSAKYDREWLYSWIKNSSAMIKSGDAQAVAIWEEYNKVAMNAYPQFSNSDIDNILAYTDYTPPAPVATVTAPVVASSVNSSGFFQ
jgi:mono/diheme cytochrome c family protein